MDLSCPSRLKLLSLARAVSLCRIQSRKDGGLVSISIMAHKGHHLREEDLTTIASQREITVVSIVTAFTQYINTTVTNYSTLTSTVTTSSMKVSDVGQNSLKVPQQRVLRYHPHEVDRELFKWIRSRDSWYNGVCIAVLYYIQIPDSALRTSPQAFYVYSTIKIITVPAIATINGQLVCTTTSVNTAIYNNTVSTTSSLYAFSGINSYAEAYFDAISEPDAITISFTTPFIYLPTPVPSKNDTRVWGYVPPALIQWAAENPDYVAKYPALSSCLPGGPSILPGTDPWARLHLVVVP